MHVITREHLVVTQSISPKALRNYSAGLLRFMCFCDELSITEDRRLVHASTGMAPIGLHDYTQSWRCR